MSSCNIMPNFVHTDTETARNISSDSAKVYWSKGNKRLNPSLIVMDVATNKYRVGLNTNEVSTIVNWIIKGDLTHV